jgi:hypothetical protein
MQLLLGGIIGVNMIRPTQQGAGGAPLGLAEKQWSWLLHVQQAPFLDHPTPSVPCSVWITAAIFFHLFFGLGWNVQFHILGPPPPRDKYPFLHLP